MPEYALLIVVIMLVAGGAYRALGRSVVTIVPPKSRTTRPL